MTCYNHPDAAAVAYCRSCGRGLCPSCQRSSEGTIYCEEHAPAQAAPAAAAYSPYTSPVPPDLSASPGLAFLLGVIPGVGAIYNGQYAKGLVHVIVLGLLISGISSDSFEGFAPLLGLLIGVFAIYMPFEAYHTAQNRQSGKPVDEFSSLVPLKGSPGLPLAPIVLIGLGVLFLLNNMEIVRLRDLLRYWPVFLIALGAYLLYDRVAQGRPKPASSSEVSHEQ